MWFRWWDPVWVLSEFYWPLVDAGETQDVYSMTISQLRYRMAALGQYKSQENYQSWFEMEYPEDNDKDSGSSNGKPQRKRRAKDDKPLTWDDWEIKSAFEYDQFWLPEQGDDGWKKHGFLRM